MVCLNLSVCMSADHVHGPRRNGRTDRDVDSGGPKKGWTNPFAAAGGDKMAMRSFIKNSSFDRLFFTILVVKSRRSVGRLPMMSIKGVAKA